MSVRSRDLLILTLALTAACAPVEEPASEIPPEESDLVAPDQKLDTGYYSNLATELEGEIRGEIRMTADDESRRLLTDAQARERYAGEQLRYAKGQLNADKLHLNLTAGELHDVVAREEGGEIVNTYAMRAETIVTFAELMEAGISDPAMLRDRSYDFIVPADPRNIFMRAAETCAEGFDAGSLADYNYFYYWKPAKEGCVIGKTSGRFTIRALLPSGQTYPEYDRLSEDGTVTMVAFFGQADHEPEVSDSDWGMINLREFESALRSRSFRQMGAADAETGKGKRWTRTRNGLNEVVDVISPRDLNTLQNDTTNLFGRMVRTHEVVMYLGHSFYGSLRQLDDMANYAPDQYQIFLMGS